jgi:hypothetical protein
MIIAAVLIVSWLVYDSYTRLQDAMARKDSRLCGGILFREFRDPCYAGVGIATSDRRLCSKPESQDERYRCLGVVEANITYCTRISSQDTRDFCCYYYVMRTGDKQWCQTIVDGGKKAECQSRGFTVSEEEHIVPTTACIAVWRPCL